VFPHAPGARIRGLGLRRTCGAAAVASLQTAKGQTFRQFGISFHRLRGPTVDETGISLMGAPSAQRSVIVLVCVNPSISWTRSP